MLKLKFVMKGYKMKKLSFLIVGLILSLNIANASDLISKASNGVLNENSLGVKKLSDEELLKLVQSGVRDLTGVLNEIESGTKGVRSAFAAIGTTISDTWINALDTFVDKLNGLQDINLGFNLESKLSKFINGISRTFNINQGNLIVQGNITEDVLPVVQGMIDTANNNLIRDINAAFSR